MAEEGLNNVHRLAPVDELHRDRVPECVSSRSLGEGYASALIPAADVMTERGWCQRLAPAVQPHRRVAARPALRALMAARDVVLESRRDLRGERTVAHSATVARDAHVRILDVEHKITNAEAAEAPT